MAETQAVGLLTAPAGRRRWGEQYWREQVEAWRSSGLSQSEYCRRGGVHWYGFRYWKAKIDFERNAGTESSKLVALNPPKVASRGGEVRIRVGAHYVVEVSAGFDGETFGQVIELLERR
jgi:hypothetical protein